MQHPLWKVELEPPYGLSLEKRTGKMGGMPSMEECAAAKCNKLDVHDGNMNGAFNVSLAEKKRNRRGHRTLSFMQFKNMFAEQQDILQEYM